MAAVLAGMRNTWPIAQMREMSSAGDCLPLGQLKDGTSASFSLNFVLLLSKKKNSTHKSYCLLQLRILGTGNRHLSSSDMKLIMLSVALLIVALHRGDTSTLGFVQAAY